MLIFFQPKSASSFELISTTGTKRMEDIGESSSSNKRTIVPCNGNNVQVPISVDVGQLDVSSGVQTGRNINANREGFTVEIPEPSELVTNLGGHHNVNETVVIQISRGNPSESFKVGLKG